MENLKKLVEACKFGFDICINSHKPFHQTIEDYLNDRVSFSDVELEVYSGIIERQNVVEISCYPENSVSYFTVYHYDIELAIDEALKIIENG